MEKKLWYCAKELVALDGIPNTPQAINSIARRDGWKSRKRVGIQGKAVEYEFNSLPLFIQEKILLKITQTELEQQKIGLQPFEKEQFEKDEVENEEFKQRQNVARQQEKHKPIRRDLKHTTEVSITPIEKLLHRTLESPKPSYLEYQVDLLKIWVDLFQQADITERYKMINFITHKGLEYLIAMINKELVNEPEKEKHQSHLPKTENNTPNHHCPNSHSPLSQSE